MINPPRVVKVERDMPLQERELLVSLLKEYKDVFIFNPGEMLGLDPVITEHHLNVDPAHKPVAQKNRHMGAKPCIAAAKEVQRLLDTGFIRECKHP